MSDIAYKYNKARNRDEAYHFPGVPLRDITEDEFKALPKHLQQSVKASDWYEQEGGAPVKKAEAAKPKKKKVVKHPAEVEAESIERLNKALADSGVQEQEPEEAQDTPEGDKE